MRGRASALTAVALVAVVAAADSAAARPEKRATGSNASIISLDQLRSTMKQHRGRVLVLHLWATWCAPCLEELPLVGTLAREARARGIDFYSVSLDDPTAQAAARVARVLAERGDRSMTRTIVRMDNPDAFVAEVDPDWSGDIPAFFVYDRAGKLRRAHVGEMTRQVFDAFVGDLTVKK